jgi:Right handed beta helix region
MLFGDPRIEGGRDSDPAGLAEVFPYISSADGITSAITVYVDSNNGARTLHVGVYANSYGHPGVLIASGSLASPKPGSWDTITVSSAAISSNRTYWVALLGVGGTLRFRDRPSGPCASEQSPRGGMTSLPSSWRPGPDASTCPLSAYVSGHLAATTTTTTQSTTPPSNTALPTISGTTTQGQTLSTSNGGWSGSPTSYSYQWRRCDGSGGNCTNISGATAGTYTETSADIGATVRSVVTASNAGGSASATSDATATVAADPPTTSFTYSPAGPVTGQPVHFDASASVCPDAPCTYTWNDDPPSGGSWSLGSGQAMDFTFQGAGTKYVTLTVSDASNHTATLEKDVVVTSGTVSPPPSPPSNTALPAIGGMATQGQTLGTSNGGWSGSPTGYGYQWRQCDSSGNGCSDIPGATSSSYTLTSGDVGHTIRSVVTASNSAGSASATSAATAAVAASGGGGSGSCDLNATPSNFASQISAAAAGQTVCLASGSYGTWNGTSKAITVTKAPGATPMMSIDFGSGASGFTLDGMSGMSGSVNSGASNITIRNSTFSGEMDFNPGENHIVFDGNTLAYMTTSGCCKIAVDGTTGTVATPALTIENNTIANGQSDGIQIEGTVSGVVILNNRFSNLCDIGVNHTDNIQFYADASAIRVAGNYFYEAQNCPTQGITSYDGGTHGVIIEDNVVDVPRDWGIELYSDDSSIVRHNTVVYHQKTYSEFGTGTGKIDIDRKSADPAGSGTHVYDNVASVSFVNGSTGTADHNTDPSTVSYAGGAPTSSSVFGDLFLTATSPGHLAASDGLDTGIRHSVS